MIRIMYCNARSPDGALRHAILLSALVALTSACATVGERPSTAGERPPEFLADFDPALLEERRAIDDADLGRVRFHILAGELSGTRGNPEAAAEHFLAASRLGAPSQVAQRGAQYAIAAQRQDLARELAELWEATGDDAAITNELLLRLALESGREAEAEARAGHYLDRFAVPGDSPWRALARTMGGTQEGGDIAVAVMRALIDERADDNADAHYALGLMALHLGDYTQAEEAARRAVEGVPSGVERDQRLLVLAAALIRSHDADHAERELRPLLETANDPVDTRQGIADLFMQSEAFPQARRLLEDAIEHSPLDGELLLSYAEAARGMGDHERWHETLTELYEAGGDMSFEAAYRFARAAEEDGDLVQARTWYRRARGGDRDVQIGLHLAQLDADEGDIASARARLEGLRDAYPQLTSRILRAEGEMLYRTRNYHEAAEVLQSGLAQYPRDEAMRYSYALALEQSDDFSEAERQLGILLAMDPDNAHALNALGYMLAVRDKRLDEAYDYIARALELMPDDPAITDSMGWVLFRMGKPNEALEYLERAYEGMPDPEVAAHLGEVLWVLGERDRAREIWDAAAEEDPAHPVLVETLRRLDPR